MPSSLNREKPIVSIENFRDTYELPEGYFAEKAVENLRSQGLLPLTYDTPLFPQINLLNAAVIWTGGVRRGIRPKAHISLRDSPQIEDFNAELGELGISFDPKQTDENHLLDAHISRLIMAIPGMFVSDGVQDERDTKASREYTFPEYLKESTEKYRSLRNTDRDLARKLIADNLQVLIRNRADTRNHGSIYRRFYLFRTYSEEHATANASFVLDMFKAVYSGMGLDKESISITPIEKNNDRAFMPYIHLTEDNVIEAIRRYGLFEIVPKRGFKELGRRVYFKQ